MSEDSQGYAEWLSTRPEIIQRLAATYPTGTKFSVDGVLCCVVGYTEGDQVVVTPADASGVPLSQDEEYHLYLDVEHIQMPASGGETNGPNG